MEERHIIYDACVQWRNYGGGGGTSEAYISILIDENLLLINCC